MHRSNEFIGDLSRRLHSPKFAREFILGTLEADPEATVEDALRRIAGVMGIKEFSKLTGVAAPNLVAFIKGRRRPKVETLDLLLKPFKLKTKIILELAG